MAPADPHNIRSLSVVVSAHSEGPLLRPTIRSIAAAISDLAAFSVNCELVIVLDNATAKTVREAHRWAEKGRVNGTVKIVTAAHGNAGASRNTGTMHATGHYLAFCDGDDLVSRNYLVEGFRILSEASEALIVHPGRVVSFGARSLVWTIPASESADHEQLIRDNLWPSSSISQRATYLKFPYNSIGVEEGFGPEDWLWNIETSIAGIPHRPALGTMFFYRVRDFGGVNNQHRQSILPQFDIAGLTRAMPLKPAAALLNAAATSRERAKFVALRIVRNCYLTVRPLLRLLLGWLPGAWRGRLYSGTLRIGELGLNLLDSYFDLKEILTSWFLRTFRGQSSPKTKRSSSKTNRPISADVVVALTNAAEIEPAISWTANSFEMLPEWNPHKDMFASILVSVVESLRGKARAVIAVPWMGVGGADLVSINYTRALLANPRYKGEISVLATHLPSHTLRHLVPDGANFVQMPEEYRALTPEQQRRLLAQVILLAQPELLLSVNCFDLSNSLELYGRQLSSTSRIYLTLFAFDRIGEGYPTNPITDDGQRAYLENIQGIITDNTVTEAAITEMLALEKSQVRVHHQPAVDEALSLQTGTKAYNTRDFTERKPFRVLWPHRLDKEKRPDSLIAIAQFAKSQGLPVEINVYGQQVLSSNGPALMKSLADAGVHYRGPYTGGLGALPTEEFDALLLTSESEGLPLVLVQSMILGLPVIATAVGGVPTIIRHGETGLLVQHPDDAEAFVNAMRLLMDSVEDRRKIIQAAFDFARGQHGWDAFTQLVDEL